MNSMTHRLYVQGCLLFLNCAITGAQELRITDFDSGGMITWANSLWNTTCHVERAATLLPTGSTSWTNATTAYATSAVSRATIPAASLSQSFYRVTYASTTLSGLVGYWPLDGDATDQSVNMNNGVINGTTFTANRLGVTNSACFFDGSGTYVGVPDASAFDVTNMTLAFWFRLDSSTTARELVNKMGAEGTQSLSFGSEYGGSDGKVYFRICTGGSLGTLTDLPSKTAIVTGLWYHFAGTYDGAAMNIYINGVHENSTPKTGAIFNSAEEIKIGRYGYYSGWVFHGAIDNVAIWGRALTSNEVSEVYGAGTF
jgi:hypothetical protein